MSESLAQRLARLEATQNVGAWGLDKFEFACPRVDDVYLDILRELSDERLIQVMFTPRNRVTLTPEEVCATDELTIALLSAPD